MARALDIGAINLDDAITGLDASQVGGLTLDNVAQEVTFYISQIEAVCGILYQGHEARFALFVRFGGSDHGGNGDCGSNFVLNNGLWFRFSNFWLFWCTWLNNWHGDSNRCLWLFVSSQ